MRNKKISRWLAGLLTVVMTVGSLTVSETAYATEEMPLIIGGYNRC